MRITSTHILERILDIWAEYCGGDWHEVIDLKHHRHYIELVTLEDSLKYSTLEEAASDCLTTIKEWMNERR